MPVTMQRTAALLPLILPYCASCPDFLAEQMIRQTAIDFSERTRAWRHVTSTEIRPTGPQSILTGNIGGTLADLLFIWSADQYQATSGEMEYEAALPAPPVAAIHEIEFAEFNGERLEPVQYTSMETPREGRPRYITQVYPGVVSVFPMQTGTLRLSVFLKPSSASQFGSDPASPLFDRFNIVPEFYLTMHGNTLAAGALERILSIPNAEWSNPREAARFGEIYREKAVSSFRANMRGQQRAPIRTASRWF